MDLGFKGNVINLKKRKFVTSYMLSIGIFPPTRSTYQPPVPPIMKLFTSHLTLHHSSKLRLSLFLLCSSQSQILASLLPELCINGLIHHSDLSLPPTPNPFLKNPVRSIPQRPQVQYQPSIYLTPINHRRP